MEVTRKFIVIFLPFVSHWIKKRKQSCWKLREALEEEFRKRVPDLTRYHFSFLILFETNSFLDCYGSSAFFNLNKWFRNCWLFCLVHLSGKKAFFLFWKDYEGIIKIAQCAMITWFLTSALLLKNHYRLKI